MTKNWILAAVLASGCVVDGTDELGETQADITTTGTPGTAVFSHILSANSLSLVSLQSITAKSLVDRRLLDDDSGRQLLQTAVACALPSGASVTLFDSVGTKHVFTGAIGLAPEWLAGRLNGTSQERWVSACILARTDQIASVAMSLRGNTPVLARVAPTEGAAFTDYEASFYGNLFVKEEDRIACEGDYGLRASSGAPVGDYLAYRLCGGGSCASSFTNNQYCMAPKVTASLRTDGLSYRAPRAADWFAATNTSSATGTWIAMTYNQSAWIYLQDGETFAAGTTNLPGASGTGDTVLRLVRWNGGAVTEVAANDDFGGTYLSYLSYVVPAHGADWYLVRQGCYSFSSCSGTTAFLDAATVVEGALPRTGYTLPASQPGQACRAETIQAASDGTANRAEVAESRCVRSLVDTTPSYDEVISVYLQPGDSALSRDLCVKLGGCK
jgi:hypothetical protein